MGTPHARGDPGPSGGFLAYRIVIVQDRVEIPGVPLNLLDGAMRGSQKHEKVRPYPGFRDRVAVDAREAVVVRCENEKRNEADLAERTVDQCGVPDIPASLRIVPAQESHIGPASRVSTIAGFDPVYVTAIPSIL